MNYFKWLYENPDVANPFEVVFVLGAMLFSITLLLFFVVVPIIFTSTVFLFILLRILIVLGISLGIGYYNSDYRTS